MTVRPPQTHPRKLPTNALDYEIVQEQAAALGRLGRALEAALSALLRHDQSQAECGGNIAALASPRRAGRDELVQEASDALWCFIIQREACGLRDQQLIIREYRIPREVQNRMGIFGSSRGTARRKRFTNP